MAYIVKKKNREGKSYVYLVEGYREKDKVKQRTLKNYGSLEELEEKEPGAFERLRQEAKDGLIGKKELTELKVTYDFNTPIADDTLSYGWKILEEVYSMLAISSVVKQLKTNASFDVDKVLKLLVFQRILHPGSKLHTVQSQKKLFGQWNLTENAVYRSLPLLHKVNEAIQLEVHKQIVNKIGRVATLVFYDVTNYYFEIDFNDEDTLDEQGAILEEGMRKRGASKERRRSPIVQLGLFMDTNGIPISYKLFRGNQTDPITYLPAIEQVKKQFGLERVIVVADKAMNSKGNIAQTLKNGDGWLFSQKHRGKCGAPKDIQTCILDAKDWEYNEQLTFAKKAMFRRRKLDNGTEIEEKVLITWSEKYARREKIRRDGALEYASKLTNAEIFRQTCKKGGKKYLSLYTIDEQTGERIAFSPLISLNAADVAFDEQFDGINVLVTSETLMSDEDMLYQYKQLSKIENCFRVTKTEFAARPVFVQKKEHIEAHFLTCFLALVIIRIVQHKIKWEHSPAVLIRALNSATANMLPNGFYRVQADEDLCGLNHLLGIEWTKGIVTHEQLVHYGKNWCTTIKNN
ncbi:MAG: IS1634 family transposase [Oscillospiraceae bacterium]